MTCSWRADQTAFPSRQNSSILLFTFSRPRYISPGQPTSSGELPALESILAVVTARPCPSSCSREYHTTLLSLVGEAAAGQQEHHPDRPQVEPRGTVACYKRGRNTLVDRTRTVLEQSTEKKIIFHTSLLLTTYVLLHTD